MTSDRLREQKYAIGKTMREAYQDSPPRCAFSAIVPECLVSGHARISVLQTSPRVNIQTYLQPCSITFHTLSPSARPRRRRARGVPGSTSSAQFGSTLDRIYPTSFILKNFVRYPVPSYC